MKTKYIIAHDLGTSGDKATLFAEDGRLISSYTKGYEAHYFNGNWAEENAEEWWDAVCITTSTLIRESKIDPQDIAVVSFSGQMMGCLCVDKEGKPLRPSIIWADMRAVKESAKLEESISQKEFYGIVGHRNTPSYGIQKLMWVKENEPEIYQATYKMLNAKDYIGYKLTGCFYTDYSDANSCGCFDITNLCWSERILQAAGIDKEKLPECKPSTFVGGYVTEEAAALTGLAEGTPVVLGAGDGVTANVGTGSIEPGKTYCCLGTSAWVTTTSEKPIFDEEMRIVNWVHAVPGYYAPNGTMQAAGASYNWAKEQICKWEKNQAKIDNASPYPLMNEEVKKSMPGANGLYFLPYLVGERAPRWNPDAKGAFIGLKAENSRGDILRSVLEGITFNLAICLDIMRNYMDIEELTVVGGGAKGDVWQQILADVFQTKIQVPEVLEEGGSMGAAVIGGVGVGLFEDFSAVNRFYKISQERMPDKILEELYREKRKIFDELYDTLEPMFGKLV